jgi:hypothetical protein
MKHNSTAMQLSKIVAAKLSGIASRADSLDADSLIEAFDLAAKELRPQLAGDQEFGRELERRVAEWKFVLLSDRPIAFEGLAELHSGVVALGFGSIEKQVTIELIFARLCHRHGRVRERDEAFERLDRAIEAQVDIAPGDVLRDLKKSVSRCRAEFSKSQ